MYMLHGCEDDREGWNRLTSFDGILLGGSRVICSLDSASVAALVVMNVDVGACLEAVMRRTLFWGAEEIVDIGETMLLAQYGPRQLHTFQRILHCQKQLLSRSRRHVLRLYRVASCLLLVLFLCRYLNIQKMRVNKAFLPRGKDCS